METGVRRFVGIIGQFTHEGITTNLKARGLFAKHFNLYEVSPRTWAKRTASLKQLRESGDLAGLVLHLPTPMVIEGSRVKYREEWRSLLDEAQKSKCLAFVFADNLAGRFRPIDPQTNEPLSDDKFAILASQDVGTVWQWRHESAIDAESRKEDIEAFLEAIHKHGIEVVPFYQRDDITIRLQDFFEDVDKNVFLRMYVPNSRFQSEQVSSLLKTFERYLRQVESRRFSIEARSTTSGTVYVFCSSEDSNSFDDLEDAFSRFDQFMKFCRDEPNQAVKLLKLPGLSEVELKFLITKYVRDYQRILIDIKHEFQQKMLLLSQRFDLEALNFVEEKLSVPMTDRGPSMLLDLSGNSGAVSINLSSIAGENSSQIFQTVGKVLNSGTVYNVEEERILELIKSHADRVTAVQLQSDIDQAKSIESAEADRKNSRGRVSAFLFKLASTASEEVVKHSAGELAAYALRKLGLPR